MGQQTFSVVGQIVNVLSFASCNIFVATTLLLYQERSHREYLKNQHGCVLMKFYLQNQVVNGPLLADPLL